MNGAVPRLAPLSRAEFDDDVRGALARAFSDDVAARYCDGPDPAPMPNVLSTLLHNPALAGPFLKYNNVLLQKPAIGHRRRELIILRVAARTHAPYEWTQHVRIARTVGITDAEIHAILNSADDYPWEQLDADVLRATDESVDRHCVTTETWTRLAQTFDERQLVELLFVIGTYTALAIVFNSVGLQLDPELRDITPSLPER